MVAPNPPQTPLPPPPPPPPTRSSPVSPLAVAVFGSLGTAIVALVILAAVIGALRPNPPAASEAVHVTVTGCTSRSDGYWQIITITYTATNPSDRPRSAFIDLSAHDVAGNQLAAAADATADIPPGGTVSGDTDVYLPPDAPAVARCTVDRVR